MLERQIAALQDFILNYGCIIPQLADYVEGIDAALEHQDIAALVNIYHELYPLAEQELWAGDNFDEMINYYHAMFREQEGLIRSIGKDYRYHFILSIPVADRPQHVKNCLESIYQQCVIFAYGGRTDGIFNRIQVIIADDSKHQHNIDQHIELADTYTEKGLRVHYSGLQEQYSLLQQIPTPLRQSLGSILPRQPAEQFYLKGPAANRNLSYLKCIELTEDKDKTLYYMVDSDQLFRVNRETQTGEQSVIAVNYFYYINQIFSTTDTAMLTGKLVGDPPVSPSVMAANFMDDVIAHLTQVSKSDALHECQFHDLANRSSQDAAYHDMASLFGFEQEKQPYPYRCSISNTHNNLESLNQFSDQLSGFFFGQHPTRKTHFQFQSKFTDLAPARTIYPGNYVVNYSGLKYVIPFSDLRLRMSGPTAGRLIQFEIKNHFVSANLPMLHKRHLKDDATDGFRPGVIQDDEVINLCDEFERQFFGDLMLFTVERITTQNDFTGAFDKEVVERIMNLVESELLELYEANHAAVLSKNAQLKSMLDDANNWWNTDADATDARSRMLWFSRSIDFNFGEDSTAYQQILSAEHRQQRKQQMTQSLLSYRQSRDVWDQFINQA